MLRENRRTDYELQRKPAHPELAGRRTAGRGRARKPNAMWKAAPNARHWRPTPPMSAMPCATPRAIARRHVLRARVGAALDRETGAPPGARLLGGRGQRRRRHGAGGGAGAVRAPAAVRREPDRIGGRRAWPRPDQRRHHHGGVQQPSHRQALAGGACRHLAAGDRFRRRGLCADGRAEDRWRATRAAVMVYRHGKHEIDLFAWPDRGAKLPAPAMTRGFRSSLLEERRPGFRRGLRRGRGRFRRNLSPWRGPSGNKPAACGVCSPETRRHAP